VLPDRLFAGLNVTRSLEGKAEVKEAVGNEPARVGLVPTATRRRDPARAEIDEVAVGRLGLRLIARDLQSARVSPKTARTMGRDLHGT
jgi:hypothetical protein